MQSANTEIQRGGGFEQKERRTAEGLPNGYSLIIETEPNIIKQNAFQVD